MLNRYTAIDLEMTGLQVKTDRILELGAVKVEEGKIMDTFSVIVNPKMMLKEEVIRLTGITQEEAQKGADLDTEMEKFLSFIGDDILVGQNLSFDFSFLQQWAVNHRMNLEKMAVDTLKLARIFLPKEMKKDLKSLCEYFGIERKMAHRAVFDASQTAAVLECLKEQYGRQNEEAFLPQKMTCKIKKQSPMTEHQRQFLEKYVSYYGIEMPELAEGITRSEASKLTDGLIARYGKLPKKKL